MYIPPTSPFVLKENTLRFCVIACFFFFVFSFLFLFFLFCDFIRLQRSHARTHARTHARKNAPFTERTQKCRREHGRRHSEIFCSAEKIDVARNDDKDKDTEEEEDEEEDENESGKTTVEGKVHPTRSSETHRKRDVSTRFRECERVQQNRAKRARGVQRRERRRRRRRRRKGEDVAFFRQQIALFVRRRQSRGSKKQRRRRRRRRRRRPREFDRTFRNVVASEELP